MVNGRPIGSTKDGFAWHTDLTYLAQSAAYTILYALEVPSEGGDTLFASTYAAYGALEERQRVALRSLSAVHSYIKLYSARINAPPLSAEQKARTPDVVHPLVRLHPRTGREGMFLNLGDCTGVQGDFGNRGMQMMRDLFDFTTKNFRYAHRWRRGDLLIWDNRGALHTATPYGAERERRLVYRTTVQGERSIGWSPHQ